MVELYAIELDYDYPKEKYNKLLQLVDETKKQRLNRFYHYKDSLRSLFGDIFIRHYIKKKHNVDLWGKQIYTLNDYGKPYIEAIKDFSFNISHSGKWVAIALSKEEVGVDVETVKETDLSIAKRFFSQQEYNDLINKPKIEQIAYFYTLWTLKESYIKARGKGLSIPLNSFSFILQNEKIKLYDHKEEDTEHWHFKQYNINTDYKLALCCAESPLPNNIEIIDTSTLTQQILA